MIISRYLKDTLQKQGRSQRWLALKTGINEKTLSGKFLSNSFSAADLILIAEALEIDLNVFKEQINLNELKGSSNSPAHYDVYKVYDEAIDNNDFNAVLESIADHMPELDERLRPSIAAVVIYMIECDITYEEFVELMCAEFWTVEQVIENYYWFYENIKTNDELVEFAKTQNNGDLILSLPSVFNEHGCLVFCDPPFTRFEGNKLYFNRPQYE